MRKMPGHKYVARVIEGKSVRYFYDQAEYSAYLHGGNKSNTNSSPINKVKQTAKAAVRTSSNTAKKAQSTTNNVQKKTSSTVEKAKSTAKTVQNTASKAKHLFDKVDTSNSSKAGKGVYVSYEDATINGGKKNNTRTINNEPKTQTKESLFNKAKKNYFQCYFR